MFTTKEVARQALNHVTPNQAYHGRLGQHIRQINSYHQARQVFISPSAMLSQLRINALVDGKEIILPGPGLKEGFYLLKPFSIPFPKLSFAITMKGIPQFGKKLSTKDLGNLGIDLLITDALAVDEQGTRLGDGLGFFDLSYAILAENMALNAHCALYAVLDDDQRLLHFTLPFDEWDAKMNGVILPSGVKVINSLIDRNHQIFWNKIPKKKIKKMQPLWDIWCKSNPV